MGKSEEIQVEIHKNQQRKGLCLHLLRYPMVAYLFCLYKLRGEGVRIRTWNKKQGKEKVRKETCLDLGLGFPRMSQNL